MAQYTYSLLNGIATFGGSVVANARSSGGCLGIEEAFRQQLIRRPKSAYY
jgi:hypothetical protein